MVYVGEIQQCKPNASWPWGRHCRLYGDSVDEVIGFAASLGLTANWLQWPVNGTQYFNLSMSKRHMALGMGAVVATPAVLADLARRAEGADGRLAS